MWGVSKQTEKDLTQNPNMYTDSEGTLYYQRNLGTLNILLDNGLERVREGIVDGFIRVIKEYDGRIYVLWQNDESKEYQIISLTSDNYDFTIELTVDGGSYSIEYFEFMDDNLYTVRRKLDTERLYLYEDSTELHEMFDEDYEITQMERNQTTNRQILIGGTNAYILGYDKDIEMVMCEHHYDNNTHTWTYDDILELEYIDNDRIFIFEHHVSDSSIAGNINWYTFEDYEWHFEEYTFFYKRAYHCFYNMQVLDSDTIIFYLPTELELYSMDVNDWGNYKKIADIPNTYIDRRFFLNGTIISGLMEDGSISLVKELSPYSTVITASDWEEGTLVDTEGTSDGLVLLEDETYGYRESDVIDLTTYNPIDYIILDWEASKVSETFNTEFSTLDDLENYYGTDVVLEDEWVSFTKDDNEFYETGFFINIDFFYPFTVITTIKLSEDTTEAKLLIKDADVIVDLILTPSTIEDYDIDLTQWKTIKVEVWESDLATLSVLEDNTWTSLGEVSVEASDTKYRYIDYLIVDDNLGTYYVKNLSTNPENIVVIEAKVDEDDWVEVDKKEKLSLITSGNNYSTLQTRQTLRGYNPKIQELNIYIETLETPGPFLDGISTSLGEVLELRKDFLLKAISQCITSVTLSVISDNYWVPIEVDQRMEVD